MTQRGITLVELMIAMAAGLVVMIALYAATEMGQRSSVAVERKVIAQQDARAALDIMALEIRMASYNSNYSAGIWTEGPSNPNCGNPSPNQGYKGIQEAGADSITVEMDINENSTIGGAGNANEIIRYNYDVANQRITRSTNCGNADAFLGPTMANLGQRDVRVVNSSVGIPIFKYYDGTGAQIAQANLPLMIPSIRRIDITLVVDTAAVDSSLQRRRRTIHSTSVIPRNHAAVY
ncbi:MAG: prepilin-type N-terminal cleavage/methylation domain-containing protein [Deltaproteobacteria bacterium]|nr:prepilin-type N-terminal cleavage/methylation domain-containing protein [Deltaproteobacteria bacterium]